MGSDRSLSVSFSLAVCLLSLFSVTSVFAQSGSTGGEWRHYAGDIGATKYSPLDQIRRDNVGDLRIAWERAAVDQSILDAAPRRKLRQQLHRGTTHGRWGALQPERCGSRRGL